jgi:two-component system nitrate/nitrite response regulator NarL
VSVNSSVQQIRVLIVAGIRLYREGLEDALRHRDPIEVVGTASDPVEGLARGRNLHPDVVLLDTSMPDSVAAVRTIVGAAPSAKVIALAVSDEEQDLIAFAEAGVAGYVTRDTALDSLAAIIQSVARGEAPCSPRLAGILLRHIGVLAAERRPTPRWPRLTERELQIVELIDRGLSNKEIARRLCIELPTVKNHIHHVLKKLHLDRRSDAAAWVRANEGDRLVLLRVAGQGN